MLWTCKYCAYSVWIGLWRNHVKFKQYSNTQFSCIFLYILYILHILCNSSFFFCFCQILPLAVWETRKQPAVTVYPRRFEQNRQRYPGLPPAVFKPPALTCVTPGGFQTAGGRLLPPARWSPAVCKPPGITQFWPPAVRVSLVVGRRLLAG